MSDNHPSNEQPSNSLLSNEIVEEPQKIASEKSTKDVPNPKIEENVENISARNPKVQTDKTILPFNLGAEVAKLKISVPLTELAKHDVYRSQINKSLNIIENADFVSLFNDRPELIFGPEVNWKPLEGGIPPFYVSLNIHDKILHNAMFNSSASHNLMPKSVMEKLNLDITRPYRDLFSFDSSQVRCLGLIKDLCVCLVLLYQNYTYGHSGSRHSTQVWHVVV